MFLRTRPTNASRRGTGARRGITPVEVLVVLFIGFVVLMIFSFSLPRMRERARMAGCQRNLGQIGIALALYDRAEGTLPRVPTLNSPPDSLGGPLGTLLGALAIPDLTGLSDPAKPPARRKSSPSGERTVPGFLCPSDINAASNSGFPAPVSFRAVAGVSVSGLNGGFAPGRSVTLSEIEESDGQAFTAAFSERLLGTGKDVPSKSRNYQVFKGPITAWGCPSDRSGTWKGDAGRSWAEASWRSSLYHHASRPNAAPSCVSDDGTAALMGASSSHLAGVNLLYFDGSVRTVSPTISLPIWQGMATTNGTLSGPPVLPPQASEEPR